MGVAGLNPYDEDEKPPVRVSKERLAELERLMERGGIDAVLTELHPFKADRDEAA